MSPASSVEQPAFAFVERVLVCGNQRNAADDRVIDPQRKSADRTVAIAVGVRAPTVEQRITARIPADRNASRADRFGCHARRARIPRQASRRNERTFASRASDGSDSADGVVLDVGDPGDGVAAILDQHVAYRFQQALLVRCPQQRTMSGAKRAQHTVTARERAVVHHDAASTCNCCNSAGAMSTPSCAAHSASAARRAPGKPYAFVVEHGGDERLDALEVPGVAGERIRIDRRGTPGRFAVDCLRRRRTSSPRSPSPRRSAP